MDVVHSADSVHDDATIDHRTAAAHREAVAFADALLALAPVDEHLHQRLARVAGTLRDVWAEQVRDEALYLAHRHLDELVHVVCRALPTADDAGADGGLGEVKEASSGAAAVPGDGESGGGADGEAAGEVRPAAAAGDGGDRSPTPDATAPEDPPPAEERPDASAAPDPDAADVSDVADAADVSDAVDVPDAPDASDVSDAPDAPDVDTDSGGDDSAPAEEDPADETTTAGEPDLQAVRRLLKSEIHSRWPSGPGRPSGGFRPQLVAPDPQIARNREFSADHRELARGLRLDALRLPVRESDLLHRKLAEVLGTDSPPDAGRLPGFGDILDPVPFEQRSETSSLEQLHDLWARLIRLLDPEDSTVAVRPPHALPNQQRPLCLIVQHAMDLIAVVRESLLVPHSGLVRANGLQNIRPLDEPTAQNWEKAVLTWLGELSRLGEHKTPSAGAAFLAKLTELDLALAQIVADPIPTSGSWWYDGRLQLRNGVNNVIGAQGAKVLATYDSYLTKEISTMADTRILPGGVPNAVLWWLKLPYEPPGGQGLVRGQAICSPRQAATRQLRH
ncbi:hypothetical protein ACFVFS_28280 [Kitasatospora sp. NPDC057692]|uniref:hypothetical protein n=1 Tax=Kitasatospora sp. NPDC057692 TaxID=3346215 RepID=UPI003673C8FC